MQLTIRMIIHAPSPAAVDQGVDVALAVECYEAAYLHLYTASQRGESQRMHNVRTFIYKSTKSLSAMYFKHRISQLLLVTNKPINQSIKVVGVVYG